MRSSYRYTVRQQTEFDLAGRVYSGVPASTNLVVPPYSFEGEKELVIGVDAAAAAL